MVGGCNGGEHRIGIRIRSAVVSKFLIKSGIERTTTSSGGESTVSDVHSAAVRHIGSVRSGDSAEIKIKGIKNISQMCLLTLTDSDQVCGIKSE